MRTRLRVVVPGGVLLGGLDGEVEDPGARVYLGRSSPHLLSMKNLVLMPVPAGAGGCCTLACALRRSEPRKHAEQHRQWRPWSGSHVRRSPSPHMGARPPDTTPTRKACHSNKNQPPSCRDPGLPCATPTTTTPTRHTTPHTTNPPQTPTGTGPISARSTTDLGAELDRSRHGVQLISARNRTDLGAEYDRSREIE